MLEYLTVYVKVDNANAVVVYACRLRTRHASVLRRSAAQSQLAAVVVLAVLVLD
jgi:hypothetical protein